jgi:hypothetical protein
MRPLSLSPSLHSGKFKEPKLNDHKHNKGPPQQETSPKPRSMSSHNPHPHTLLTGDYPPLDDELRSTWLQPFNRSSVAKDLPRLAGRIEIEAPVEHKRLSSYVSTLRLSLHGDMLDKEQDKIEIIQDEPNLSPSHEHSTTSHIKSAIIEVARNVESRERFEMIRSAMERFNHYSDWELEMKELFHEVIGEESNTAKVFKCITQNILFAGCIEIKKKIPMAMTRDVRGPEGWKILVVFTKETISITHYRREQSLATAPATEQFWFEWRLSMMFDKGLRDMQASSLKVTNLGFGENAAGPFKADLNKVLASGNLIVG